MSSELLEIAKNSIGYQQLFAPDARVIVAVSGGADSIALLDVLATLRSSWRIELHVAHLDHALRPDSATDAAFVARAASVRSLRVTVKQRDVQQLCSARGWSLEEGARRIRYEFFQQVAEQQGADCIALAHTADDQVETVLLRLIRGTGLLGLGAMPFRRRLGETWIVRPLLNATRRQVLDHLAHAELSHREDQSNADLRFSRNRIRHELLPLLERHYNANIRHTLMQLAEQSRCDYAYLDQAASRQWRRLVKSATNPRVRFTTTPPAWRGASRVREPSDNDPSQVGIMIRGFLRQPKALQRQLVRRAIEQVKGDLRGFEFRHWLEVERLFSHRPVGTLLDLPGGLRLQRRATQVICELATTNQQGASESKSRARACAVRNSRGILQ